MFNKIAKGMPAKHINVQNMKELETLYHIIKGINPKSYLEIGASNGNSLWVLAHALEKGSRVEFIDLGEKHTVECLMQCADKLMAEYDIRAYLGRSEEWAERIKENNPDGYDVILIDGDHTFEGVKRDWENYKDLANKLIVFHDINLPGVREFFDSLKMGVKIYSVGKYLKHEREHGMGFGLIYVEK